MFRALAESVDKVVESVDKVVESVQTSVQAVAESVETAAKVAIYPWGLPQSVDPDKIRKLADPFGLLPLQLVRHS